MTSRAASVIAATIASSDRAELIVSAARLSRWSCSDRARSDSAWSLIFCVFLKRSTKTDTFVRRTSGANGVMM